ncbi:MAG TPA: hypothetical protein VJW76_14400, partial [Verrucomicrobiae bacterium]|nr:hypothetical protein [Verrucomicrobiae bacterium]
MKRFPPQWSLPLFALFLLLPAGCSTNHYRKSADKEAYKVIKEKTPLVKNMDDQFSIEQTNQLSLEGLQQVTSAEESLGPDGQKEVGSHVLSLEKALEVAVRHNRQYQSRKEQLYLSALQLTLARHQFRPLFSGGVGARYDVTTEQALDLIPDPENPGEFITVLSDNLVEEHRIGADGSVRGSWLIRDVGRITAAFTTDFFRYLTGDPRTLTSSQIGATFTRPLLRNAGFKQEIENLTQAER